MVMWIKCFCRVVVVLVLVVVVVVSWWSWYLLGAFGMAERARKITLRMMQLR